MGTAGAAKAGRSLRDIEISVGGTVGFGDDLEQMIRAVKPGLAFALGAMGSAKTNFYNEAYRRSGFEDAAIEVQRLWVDGKRDQAIARVPDEMVRACNLLGSEDMVRERIRSYRDAGVNTLMIDPRGQTQTARLDTLAHTLDLVRQESPGS